MKYLGVWLLKNPDKMVSFNYNLIWKKIQKQIKGWKRKKLRRMAKIRALKMMIIPKMLYILQVLPGNFPRAKLREWDTKLNFWIEGSKRPRIRKRWLIATENEGGWGNPCLEFYRDAYQIDRLMEIQLLEEKKWVKLEKEINDIKNEELLFRKWSRKEINILFDPLKAGMEIWMKWQAKLRVKNSKLSTLHVININKEGNLTKTIKELKDKGILRIEQLYEEDGRIKRGKLERCLGQHRWMQINAICIYLSKSENKETFLQEETRLEEILKEKFKDTTPQAGNIYRMLLQAEEAVIKGLTRCWQDELEINEWEMESIVDKIKRIKNTRIREMRRKILHKWYYTPLQLAHFQSANKGNCWHGCKEKGVFMHMFWECTKVQKFWKQVQDVTNKILNTDWRITKEAALLVKQSEVKVHEEIKIAVLESAQATIVLGWKDAGKWTLQNWCKYMVDHIHFEIMEIRLNNFNEGKLKALMERWEKVKDYMLNVICDENVRNKLQSLFNV